MKIRLSIIFAALLICFCSVWSYANIVTIDIASRSAKSDTDALRVRARQVRVKDDQVGLVVESTSNNPQKAVARFNGIKNTDYDVYINGDYVGKKTFGDLQSGIEISIPGTASDPVMMRCLNALKDKVSVEYKRLQKVKDSEAQRASYTLSQADDWVKSGINSDQAYRSADIIINPADIVLQNMQFRTRSDAADTAATAVRACWLLQQARSRMYSVITDKKLRNSTVSVLTPVELTYVYSVKNIRAHVDVVLLNECNLPIHGNIEISVPNGWKSNAKGLSFNNIKSGKTFKLSFDLFPATKNASIPSDIPIAANIGVKQNKIIAKFRLQAVSDKSEISK